MTTEQKDLLKVELNALLQSQFHRDKRVQQLRLFSFGIITAILSFTPITFWYVVPILLLVCITLAGLLVFDMFYRKLDRQVDARIRIVSDAIQNHRSEVQPFPVKFDKLDFEFKTEQLWYIFIMAVAGLIILLKGLSSNWPHF